MSGKIYLVPTTLGDTSIDLVIPAEVKIKICVLKYFIVENIRTARRFLKQIDKNIEIDKLTFFELNKHTDSNDFSSYLLPIIEGNDAGIISEAGNPGIADPGSDIVSLAHQKNIEIVPLVGPSSILLALISSGMNGQNFAFNGYLPVEKSEKIRKIQFLENRAKAENQSQIFMETPFRNAKMLDDLLAACKNTTLLCIAADITLSEQFIKTKTIADWKKNKPDINKRPAIFIIH